MTDTFDTSGALRQILVLIDAHRYTEARALINKVLTHDPTNAMAWYFASFVVETQAEQIRALERALSFAPGHQLAHQRLQEIRSVAGQAVRPEPVKPPPRSSGITTLIMWGGVVVIIILAVILAYLYLESPVPIPSDTTPNVFLPVTPTTMPTPESDATPDYNGMVLPVRFIVVDAEYSQSLDKIIIATTEPDQVLIYDPLTNTYAAVDLQLPPRFISVNQSGTGAAVAHEGAVTVINLERGIQQHFLTISVAPADIILTDDNWVYIPAVNEEFLYSIDIFAERITTHKGQLIDPGSVYRLHPAGDRLYGADQIIEPDNIERIDLIDHVPTYAYDSPEMGRYEMCHNLWLTESGDRIITACGHVFQTGNSEEEDMIYAGSLAGINQIGDAAHSEEANLIVAVPDVHGGESNLIGLWQGDTLEFVENVFMPDMVLQNRPFTSNGRWVFWNQAGTQYYVIAQASNPEGWFNNYAIYYGHTD